MSSESTRALFESAAASGVRQLLQSFWQATGGMLRITALLLIPLLITLGYLRLHVAMSSLNRQTGLAELRKEELLKRNRALKSALTNLALERGENPYRWQMYEASPLAADENKIVRVRLPERFTDDPPVEIMQPDR